MTGLRAHANALPPPAAARTAALPSPAQRVATGWARPVSPPATAELDSVRGRGPAGTSPAGPAGRRPGRPRPPGRGSPENRGSTRDGLELAARFAALWLEVEAGMRPVSLLRGLAVPSALPRSGVRRQHRTGCVRRMRAVPAGPHDMDVVALVERDGRMGALGMRLHCNGEAWLVVEAGCPEDHRPAVGTRDIPTA